MLKKIFSDRQQADGPRALAKRKIAAPGGIFRDLKLGLRGLQGVSNRALECYLRAAGFMATPVVVSVEVVT